MIFKISWAADWGVRDHVVSIGKTSFRVQLLIGRIPSQKELLNVIFVLSSWPNSFFYFWATRRRPSGRLYENI